MNRTVSATGMSLTSTAPANLLITDAASDPAVAESWKSSIAASESYLGKLYPSSTDDGINFYAVNDGQTIGGNNIGGTADTGVTTFKTTGVEKLSTNTKTTGYWAEYTLKMKTTGESDLLVYLDSIDIATEATYKDVTAAMAINASVVGYYTATNGTEATGLYNEGSTYYERTGSEGSYVYTPVTDELREKASVVGLYTKSGSDYTEITASPTSYDDGTTYYQKLDVGAIVDTSSFIDGTTSVADYYILNNGVYTKCATDAKFATGTTYYTSVSIYNCVRIAIFTDNGTGTMDEDNAVGVYAIDETNSVTPIASVDGSGAFTLGSLTIKNQGDNTATFTVKGNTSGSTNVTEILVKVWIEGQHPSCINAAAGESFNIGLTFKVASGS